MVERKLRYTLSAAAIVGVFLCALSLLVAATAAANFVPGQQISSASHATEQP